MGILRTLLTTLLFKAIIDGIPLVSQTLLGRAITLPNMARLFQPFKPIIEACGKKFSLCKSLPKILPKLPCVIGVLSVGAASYGLVAGAEFNWEAAGATAVEIADTIGDCRSRGLGGGGDGPNVCNSFPAGTRVMLADGTSRPIEQIRVGERVLATDPETGESNPRAVTHLITGEGEKHLVELSLATDGGTRTLVATAGHPFWSVERGAWMDAGELQAGELVQEADGTYVRVLRTDLRMTVATVYNLTVEVDHTYYVLAGDDPVLVHNSNCDITQNLGLNLERAGFAKPGDGWEAHHIVARGDIRAAEVKKIMEEKWGIPVDSAANGVWLPGPDVPGGYRETYHRGVHTAAYYQAVDAAVRNASSADEVIEALDDIRSQLQAGTIW